MGKKNFKDDDEYRRRRERNNEAVKKSRVKSKMRSQATQERVQQLQMENTQLEEKMKYLSSEVEFLKEMLCNSNGVEGAESTRVQQLLEDLNNQSMESYSSTSSSAHPAPAAGTRRSSRKSTEHKY